MRHRSTGEHPPATATSFIGSFLDELNHAEIVLRGDIDAATVDRLDSHIHAVLASTTQFITIDAATVNSHDSALLDLLGRTQHRLGLRRGLLQVQGLHPSLLTTADSDPARVPVPARAPLAPAQESMV